MKTKIVGFVALLGMTVASAADVPVTFTQLTGLNGGSPAQTAVFRADLSLVGISSILSITINDSSAGLGGAVGQFSGFDLDAIKLSYTSVGTATEAAALVGLNVFDFASGVIFDPGVQRAPADPKFFGTGPTGATVDNSVARLGLFDGNSTTDASAAGFISMGDSGRLTFNLTSGVTPSGLFLYIGEVGNNGEVAAGTITVSDAPVRTPDGGLTVAWLGVAIVGLLALRRKWV